MGSLSGLVLALLALVGYSAGAVLAGRSKVVTPTLVDLGVIVVLWAVALDTRDLVGRWLAILVWMSAGLVIGAVLTALRRERYPDNRAPVRSASASSLRRIWDGWKAFAVAMGNFQSRTWLALFYFVIVTPFGVLARLFSDPLRLRSPGRVSVWQERAGTGIELQDGERQS